GHPDRRAGRGHPDNRRAADPALSRARGGPADDPLRPGLTAPPARAGRQKREEPCSRVIGMTVAGALAQGITLRWADCLPTAHIISEQAVDCIARGEDLSDGRSSRVWETSRSGPA